MTLTKTSGLFLALFMLGVAVVWMTVRDKSADQFPVKDKDITSAKNPEPRLVPSVMEKIPDLVSTSGIEGFEDWMAGYINADPSARHQEIEEGAAIAAMRRDELKSIMRIDPETALALAVPYELRREFPSEIIEWLETPVSAHAQYELLVYCPEPGQEGGGFERIASIDGNRYDVFTYRRGLDIATKDSLPIQGIAIDDVLVMTDDPVRVLSENELDDREIQSGFAVEVGGHVFEVSGGESLIGMREIINENEASLGPRTTANYGALLRGEVDGVTLLFSVDPNDGFGYDELPETHSAHTEGPKTMLYIRARFSDQAADYEPNDLSTLMQRQADCEAYWFENSYGKSILTTTFTDVITLPNSASYYADQTSGRLNTLYDDALPLVKATGEAKGQDWDEANYDFFTMLTTGGTWGYAGVASVGGRRSHLNGAGASNLRTASHEFGHNLGLLHANYWRTDSPSPIGRDSIPGGYVGDDVRDERIEYGHKFSVMSAQNGGGDFNEGRGHYTTGEKVKLDWLASGDNDWVSVDETTETPIRLYRHDVETADFASMTPGVARAIKINRDTGDYAENDKRRYWLSYRRLPTNGISENWLPFGLQVDWQRETYGGDGSILLDMTPYSRDSDTSNVGSSADNSDKEDAIVVVGRTYSDEVGDIHFTPIAQGGENPNEWMDVLVHIGTQQGNTDPEITAFAASANQTASGVPVDFSASAEDADGDPIYYTWTFGDNAMVVESLNSATVTKSWSRVGFSPVRVTASDGKGGSDTRELIVQVGSPANTNFIQGRLIHAGLPVEGARVNVGTARQAWTGGDGRYILPGLRPDSYFVFAAKDGLTFEAQFSYPVFLTELNACGIDFIAKEDGLGTGVPELALLPFESVVPLGAQLNLKALLWDADGKRMPASPLWSVTGGGTISETGTFTANEVGGPYMVSASQGASSAEAFVSVVDVKAIGVVALDSQVEEPGIEDAVFRIKRYGGTDGELAVKLRIEGTASAGLDYVPPESVVVIPDGLGVVDLSIDILDDFVFEPTETMTLTLIEDSAYTLFAAEASASIEILDDSDMAPIVTILSPRVPVAIVPDGTGLLIEAEVIDDGFPDPPGVVSLSWSLLDGPEGGSVVFSPPQSKEMVAYFSGPGFYRIQFSASDGVNTGTAQLSVHAGIVTGEDPSIENEVVYLSMDEGSGVAVMDARGGDNNGTLIGGATWLTGENAISGSAIQFDGTDDQINIPDSDEINLLDHSLRSIALWFKADDPLNEAKQMIYEEGGSVRGLSIYLEEGVLHVGGWNSGGSGWEATSFSTELTNTDWHHVGLVLDTTASNDAQPDAFRVYLDGLEFGSGVAAPLDAHSGDIALGGNRGSTRYHDGTTSASVDRFAGILDEFHLWNRALEPAEMGQLFSRGYTGPKLSLSSLDPSRGAVVVPEGMGILLKGEVSSSEALNANWSEVASPVEGFATFVDAGQGNQLVRFSKPGYYKFRLSVDDGKQLSAVDVSVHAVLDIGENPIVEEEAIYYSFDEMSGSLVHNNAGDHTPASLRGDPALSERGEGISGFAVTLSTDRDYITPQDWSPLGESALKKSYSVWIRPSEASPGEREVIFQWGQEDQGMNIYLDDNVLFAGGWETSEPKWSTFLSSPISRNEWHHVVVTLDLSEESELANDGLKLYLDGLLVASGIGGKIEGHGSSRIGLIAVRTLFHDDSLGGSRENNYTGTIDEFHYYHEYALSIEEVGQLYAFGNVGPVVDAGLDQPSLSELKVSLSGSATDDGRWESPLTYEWLFAGRPGAGTFTNTNTTDAELDLFFGGSYEVALSAFDGQVTTFDTVTVSVDQPTYFDQFMDSYPTLEGAERDYLSNPDNDLWTNIEEYGFGGAPDGSGTGNELWIKSELVREGEAMYFEFQFPRRLDAALRGLNYEIQFSNDLSVQSWISQSYTVLETASIDDNFEEIRLRVNEPIYTEIMPLFGRVRVLLNE